jgi:rhodanese-related sulfurtransferase
VVAIYLRNIAPNFVSQSSINMTKPIYFYLRLSVYSLLVLCLLLVTMIKQPKFFNQLGILPTQAQYWWLIGDGIRQANASEIDQLQLRRWLKEKPQTLFLVDVRTAEEYQLGHLETAVSIPLADFESGRAVERIKKHQLKRMLVTYCASGWRSYKALAILRDHNIAGSNLTGGYNAW